MVLKYIFKISIKLNQGREIYATIIRDGKEISYIADNEFYNFDYQQANFLYKPIKLLKDDQIRVKCVYSSSNVNSFTLVSKIYFAKISLLIN